jgi:hypothetical protein
MTRQVRQKLTRPRRCTAVARSLLSLVLCRHTPPKQASKQAGEQAGEDSPRQSHILTPCTTFHTVAAHQPTARHAAAARPQNTPPFTTHHCYTHPPTHPPARWCPGPPLCCPAAAPAPAAAPQWPACCSSGGQPTLPAPQSSPPAQCRAGGLAAGRQVGGRQQWFCYPTAAINDSHAAAAGCAACSARQWAAALGPALLRRPRQRLLQQAALVAAEGCEPPPAQAGLPLAAAPPAWGLMLPLRSAAPCRLEADCAAASAAAVAMLLLRLLLPLPLLPPLPAAPPQRCCSKRAHPGAAAGQPAHPHARHTAAAAGLVACRHRATSESGATSQQRKQKQRALIRPSDPPNQLAARDPAGARKRAPAPRGRLKVCQLLLESLRILQAWEVR